MTDEFYFDLYDKLYQTGYHNDQTLSHTPKMFPYLHQTTKDGGRVLDVGCSHGYAVLAMQNMGYETYGIDVSEIAINYCTNRQLTTCRVESITKTSFNDNFFDTIISTDTLEHLLPKDVDLAIKELYRITKNFCVLSIACDPEGNKDPLKKVQQVFNQYNNLDGLHTCLMQPEQWDTKFLQAGFNKHQTISFTNNDYRVIYRKP